MDTMSVHSVDDDSDSSNVDSSFDFDDEILNSRAYCRVFAALIKQEVSRQQSERDTSTRNPAPGDSANQSDMAEEFWSVKSKIDRRSEHERQQAATGSESLAGIVNLEVTPLAVLYLGSYPYTFVTSERSLIMLRHKHLVARRGPPVLEGPHGVN